MYIYKHLVDFYDFHVGKSTIPMDGMGFFMTQVFLKTRMAWPSLGPWTQPNFNRGSPILWNLELVVYFGDLFWF